MAGPVVVDANVIFSSLLVEESRLRERLLTGNDDFYIANSTIVDLFRHKEKIVKCGKLSSDEVNEILYSVLEQVTVIRESRIPAEVRSEANDLCKDIDPDDAPHVALTLQFDGRLWTGDKQLRSGLEAKGFDRFFDP